MECEIDFSLSRLLCVIWCLLMVMVNFDLQVEKKMRVMMKMLLLCCESLN